MSKSQEHVPAAISLWRMADFRRLWIGQTISQIGSNIGGGAIGLTAILLLAATPTQMGILAAATAAPMLLFSLPVGVWVDRWRRRPVLIAADAGRALLLALVPLAALAGLLRIEQLYVVAALMALLTIFFEVAYHAYVPALLPRERLVEGNSRLGASASVAEIAGQPIGGALVQWIGAPLTILLDSVSFLVSAFAVWRIRTPEPAPVPSHEQRDMVGDIIEGVRLVRSDRLLAPMARATVTTSFAGSIIGTLYGLYVLRELGLSPFLLGVIIGVGGIGALAGALLADRIVRRLGIGRALIGALLVGSITGVFTLIARGEMAFPLMMIAQAGDIGLSIFFLGTISLRQAATPGRLLGRANASIQFLEGGAGLLGALAGGILGEWIGLRAAIGVGVLGMLLASFWIIFSPVRTLRELPDM